MKYVVFVLGGDDRFADRSPKTLKKSLKIDCPLPGLNE